MQDLQLKFAEIAPSSDDFEIALDILRQSFPPVETRNRDEQIAVAAHKDYRLCLVKDGNSVVGVVGIWQTDGMLYLENFCVAPDLRNGGYGSAIVRRLAQAADGGAFVLEAELPTDDITRRRIGFYKRNGMVVNAYPHVQAHLRAGDPDLPLVVLSYGRGLLPSEYAAFRKYLDDNVDVR